MKKTVALSLTLAAALGLGACSSQTNNEAAAAADNASAEVAATSSEAVNDVSAAADEAGNALSESADTAGNVLSNAGDAVPLFVCRCGALGSGSEPLQERDECRRPS
jgi:phage-related tail protein